jgi:hypothetical protein
MHRPYIQDVDQLPSLERGRRRRIVSPNVLLPATIYNVQFAD